VRLVENPKPVIAGLVPAIHELRLGQRSGMAATRAAMKKWNFITNR
jgi:hypothetical protein